MWTLPLRNEKTGSVFSDCDDVSDPEGNVSESVSQSVSQWVSEGKDDL